MGTTFLIAVAVFVVAYAIIISEKMHRTVIAIAGAVSMVLLGIINQEEAVREVASALRRARTEIATRKGPMGSFLFLGPTGVGKTETAKALAAIYFGDRKSVV